MVGATGMLGGEIVRLLADAEQRVRAVVRPMAEGATLNPLARAQRAALDALPVEKVVADLKDPSSLERACDGVTSVVSTATALTSRQPGDSIERVDERGTLELLDTAERAGAERVTFVSFLPNELEYEFQVAKRRVEERVRSSSLHYTILQATAFMELWLSPVLGFDPMGGSARLLGTGENPVSWVSLHDVARFAAASVEQGPLTDKTVPLGGPDALSQHQVLEIFAELGATNVSVEAMPEPAIEAMFKGATDPVQRAMAAAMWTTARGQVVDPRPAQELLPGRMRSVRDFAAGILQRHSAPPS